MSAPLKFENVAIVKAHGSEPLIPRSVLEKEARFNMVTVRIQGEYSVTAERLRRPVGSVRFVDDRGQVVGFLVREMALLVVEPTLPDETVREMARLASVFVNAKEGFTTIALRLLKLAAIIAATQGIEGFEATPDTVTLCGVTVTRENLYDVLADMEKLKTMEDCLRNAIKTVFGEPVRVGGEDVL